MLFPAAAREAADRMAASCSPDHLRGISGQLSRRYQQDGGKGNALVTADEEALVYSLVRMPATFGAASFALEHTLPFLSEELHTLFDAGAGTGAVGWAAEELLPLQRIVCLEREASMRRLGETLARQGGPVLSKAQWLAGDLVSCRETVPFDIVTASYVLNEMTPAQFEKALQTLWTLTGKLLLLIEPGTPQGFERLRSARDLLQGMGGYIAAPCPHGNVCPLGQGDWCHFSVRVQRSRLHRLMKGGEAPYEDEKFSYLAVTRRPSLPCPPGGRVLRHPQIGKGHIGFTLCTPETIQNVTVTKKHPAYRQARKAEWGDYLTLDPSVAFA